MIEFRVSGIPKGQPRQKSFARKFADGKYRAIRITPDTAEFWKECIFEGAKPHIPATPFDCPMSVVIRHFFPRPKSHFRSNGELKPTAPLFHVSTPDVDNLWKAFGDAMTTMGFWRDDSIVADTKITKEYGDFPGALIKIQPLGVKA